MRIVEKPRGFCPGMGNQGFGLGEFQLEGLTQEVSQPLLDGLCFRLWTDETQQKIIGIPTIPQPSVVWVVGDDRRKPLCLRA